MFGVETRSFKITGNGKGVKAEYVLLVEHFLTDSHLISSNTENFPHQAMVKIIYIAYSKTK